MSSKNQAVAYLTKDADGLLWEYISSNGSGYQKTGILNYINQIKGMDISMYSDAKIVKKKIKVNRINTVQISAQVKGSDVVKFLNQMGMSKEINAAAAVDYNTLPAIKVTCWIDKKNLSSSQNHGGYESVYERVYVGAVSEAGTGSETCLFAGKSNGNL